MTVLLGLALAADPVEEKPVDDDDTNPAEKRRALRWSVVTARSE